MAKTETYTTRRGATLAYHFDRLSEAASPVVVVQHGLVASIKDPLFEPLLSNGVSVLNIARPGYGDSSCYRLNDVYEYGALAEELIDFLGISGVFLLGSSSGAPYALALARRMDARIGRTFIFSGVPLLTDSRVAELWPYPLEKGKSLEHYQNVAAEIFSWMKEAEPSDAIEDARRNNFFGPALDLKVRSEDWGFSLAEIGCQVVLEHSVDDKEIPFETAKITCSLLRKASLWQRRSGGHFSIETFSHFLSETVLPEMRAFQIKR